MAITKLSISRPMLSRSSSSSALRPRPIIHRVVRVLVGSEQREFVVNKELLFEASSLFEEKLSADSNTLWLPNESPSMFELFTVWLHQPQSFRRHLDNTITLACPSNPSKDKDSAESLLAQRLQWALIRLHLFASSLGLPPLQDAAMDAIQDLHLRRDWDVSPGVIRYIYSQCDDTSSIRLRRWGVAMVAFSLSGALTEGDGSPLTIPAMFTILFEKYPDFATDYALHLRKMQTSGLDVRFKNPQLRIPANKLRNEERRFAFRQCAFHTHRAAVGERKCPHMVSETRTKRMPLIAPLPEDIQAELQVARNFNPDMPKALRRLKSVTTIRAW